MRCYWYTERDTACPGRAPGAWKPGYFHIILIWSSLWGSPGSWTHFPGSPRVSGGRGRMFQFPGSERNSVMEREIWTSLHTHHHHFSKVDPNFVYNKKYKPVYEHVNKPYNASSLELLKYIFEKSSHSHTIIILSWKADPNYVSNKSYKLINFLFSHS